MAITTKRITMRQGSSADWEANKTKILSGELAIVNDTEEAYFAPKDGSPKRFATEDDVERLTGQIEDLEENGVGGGATDEQVSTAVKEWLDEHPEATTTVQDGSITEEKLAIDTEVIDTAVIGTLTVKDAKGNTVGTYQGKAVTITLPESEGEKSNINPVEATSDMTQPVGVNAEGKLFTAPPTTGASGVGSWRLIKTLNFGTETSDISFDTDDNGETFELSEIMLQGTLPAYSGYIYVRDYTKKGNGYGHGGNNSMWPTASKPMNWWLAPIGGKLITLFGVSSKAVLEPYDTNSSCPEKLTGISVGSSVGFTASGTMYIYGR